MNFTQAACFAAMLILFGWLVSPRVELQQAEKRMLLAFAAATAFFIVILWLWAIRASQLGPHRIIQSINGHVISEFWTTNPMYVTYEGMPVPPIRWGQAAASGVVLKTNYYWHIWSIFAK